MTTAAYCVRGPGGCQRRMRRVPSVRLMAMVSLAATTPMIAIAQQATTLNGPPVQVTPYVSEPGVPEINIPIGTPTPPLTGDGTGNGEWEHGGLSQHRALNTMLGTSWGAQATADAQSLGVNASALAATCVIESGCQNVGGSGAKVSFRCFLPRIRKAYRRPSRKPAACVADRQGSAGMNDPVTEAIAAFGDLMQANQALTNAGISSPTVLDARAYDNSALRLECSAAGFSKRSYETNM